MMKKGLKPCSDVEDNWLGTYDQGRNVFARRIYGFRISVLFGLSLTIISSIIGVAAGGVQGYFGGWIDLSFQRLIEVWSAIPSLYLLLILSSRSESTRLNSSHSPISYAVFCLELTSMLFERVS